VRFNFPVGIPHGSDPDGIREILLEIAENHPGVLKEPSSDVLFKEFGKESLVLVLRVWTNEYTHRPNVLRSELNFQIMQRFRELNLSVAPPY
jgi:small-conductance mechanosensitive channel